MTKSKISVKEFWDEESKSYRVAQWEQSNVAKYDFHYTKNVLLNLLSPKPTDKILEIGCGAGKWVGVIAPKCKGLVAIDLSQRMIQQAKKYSKNFSNVNFLCNDFMKQTFDDKFDKVFAVRVVEYIHNKIKMFKKVHSLLEKNGKLVFITKNKPCLWDSSKKAKGFWQEKISPFNFAKLLRKSGFNDIEIKPVVLRLPIFKSGNRELPLVSKKYEKLFLDFFSGLTDFSLNSENMISNLFLLTSESYALSCSKS